MRCHDCKARIPLKVCKSEAGYYVGRECENCGPYSNEGFGYYNNSEGARKELSFIKNGPEEVEGDDE